jgi:hypothetical protein
MQIRISILPPLYILSLLRSIVAKIRVLRVVKFIFAWDPSEQDVIVFTTDPEFSAMLRNADLLCVREHSATSLKGLLAIRLNTIKAKLFKDDDKVDV